LVWSGQFQFEQGGNGTGGHARRQEHAEIAGNLAEHLHAVTWSNKVAALLQELEPEHSPPAKSAKLEHGEILSQREVENLQLLKSDLKGPEIADRLIVSLNTIRFHTQNIYQKLWVNNRLEAIRRPKNSASRSSLSIRHTPGSSANPPGLPLLIELPHHVGTTYIAEMYPGTRNKMPHGYPDTCEHPTIHAEAEAHSALRRRMVPHAPQRLSQRKTLVVLAICMALQMTSFVMILPLFARRFSEIGAGVGALGESAMAYALAATLSAPFMGTLADRFGRRLLVLVSLGTYVLTFSGYCCLIGRDVHPAA
jgi:DNA-binding CsgD family transcriptional regulator